MPAFRLFWKAHKEFLLYVFFGGCTTLVNLTAYAVCYYGLSVSNTGAAATAWLLGVVFAFVTNKWWVFGSRSMQCGLLVRELTSFVGCRAATGLLDLAIMYVCVDRLHMHGLFTKAASNVLVIVLNFIASKLLIFAHKNF